MAPTPPQPYSAVAQGALLRAINRLFDFDRPANSHNELTDGIVLGHILHELDSEFEPSHLESAQGASKYLTNKRNLQAIYKALFRFIRRDVPELACQAKKFDYNAIAENPDSEGISQVPSPARVRHLISRSELERYDELTHTSLQLLAVMVCAAVLGPDNERYVPRIQHSLDREAQGEIMQIIHNMQQDGEASKDDNDIDEAIDAVMEARDIDLLVEEQNATLRQQLDTTKKTLSDYITRLEHLQLSHEELRYEKDKNDRELEVLRKATRDGANNAESIKLLEGQVHEQMEVIARYEETIVSLEKSKAHLETEVKRLTQKSFQADELRDQASEWRHKAEELEKRANTAERYKQKLEAQQHLVQEVQNLQYERAEMQEQLRSLTNDKDRFARGRKAEDELTKMITQSEQDLWDERGQKTQLMKDNGMLEDELTRLKSQRTHDEAFIQDLQEQLQNGAGGASSRNLADELTENDDDGHAPISLDMSRLKAENDLLRRTMGPAGDAFGSRREAEEQKRQRDAIQSRYNDIFEQHAIAQEQVEALMKGLSGPEDQAFVNLRIQCTQATTENEKFRRKFDDLEAQAADRDRELLSVKTELSAMGKDSVEALEELQRADKLINESLRDELARLQDKHSLVVGERDAQKSQLIEVFLAKDKLRKDMEAGAGKDVQDAVAKDPDVVEAVRKDSEKIDKLRARLVERNQQIEQSEQERIDLQRQLKAALDGETAAAQKATADEVIRNLRRELNLMATAWYDLTGRLQSNHVVLQRRQDAPRSWLNKQRQMVNATPKNKK